MYINVQVIQWIIGSLMLLIIAVPLIIKQYYITLTKDKILVRVVGSQEEEISYLLKVDGLVTEPNPKGRAYVVKPKSIDPKTKEISGSTYEMYYPEGLPRFLQVRIRAMDCNEGNPNAINHYGKQEALNITDKEIGTLKKEQFSALAVEASKDYKELLKDIKNYIQPGLNRTIVYILLAATIAGIVAVAYLSYQNSQAIANLTSMWGW